MVGFTSDELILKMINAYKKDCQRKIEKVKITDSIENVNFVKEISKCNIKKNIQDFKKNKEIYPITCIIKKMLHANSENRKGNYDLIVGEEKGDFTIRIYLSKQLNCLISKKMIKKDDKLTFITGTATLMKCVNENKLFIIPTKCELIEK